MTREEAIINLNMISVAFVDPVTMEHRKLIDDTFDMAIQALSQEPCEKCIYAEGSPFCLQYCPCDAERKKKSRVVEPKGGV